MSNTQALIPDYEVFKNERNALAFFFAKEPRLDTNPEEGPFWFTVERNRIVAGAEGCSAVFEGVQSNIIDIAKQRGVLMMVEFENQQPVRCTPCYLTDTF